MASSTFSGMSGPASSGSSIVPPVTMAASGTAAPPHTITMQLNADQVEKLCRTFATSPSGTTIAVVVEAQPARDLVLARTIDHAVREGAFPILVLKDSHTGALVARDYIVEHCSTVNRGSVRFYTRPSRHGGWPSAYGCVVLVSTPGAFAALEQRTARMPQLGFTLAKFRLVVLNSCPHNTPANFWPAAEKLIKNNNQAQTAQGSASTPPQRVMGLFHEPMHGNRRNPVLALFPDTLVVTIEDVVLSTAALSPSVVQDQPEVAQATAADTATASAVG